MVADRVNPLLKKTFQGGSHFVSILERNRLNLVQRDKIIIRNQTFLPLLQEKAMRGINANSKSLFIFLDIDYFKGPQRRAAPRIPGLSRSVE